MAEAEHSHLHYHQGQSLPHDHLHDYVFLLHRHEGSASGATGEETMIERVRREPPTPLPPRQPLSGAAGLEPATCSFEGVGCRAMVSQGSKAN